MPGRSPGLQGGTAPARAFADFMKVAVARRPVEQFETRGADARLAARARRGSMGLNTVDDAAAGRCRRQSDRPAGRPATTRWRRRPQRPRQPVDQQWLDEVLRRNPETRRRNPAPPPAAAGPATQPPPRQPRRRPTRFSRGPSASQLGPRRGDIAAVKLAPPARGSRGHGSCGRGARPHARPRQRSSCGGARISRQL